MTKFFNPNILFFISVQMLTVIISTIKSVLTVKGSPTIAAVVNAISYTFSTIVTKLLTEQSFAVAITVAFFTNLIGVYIAKWIMSKSRKENPWVIMTTVPAQFEKEIENMMAVNALDHTLMLTQNNELMLHIYSYNRDQSKRTKSILDHFDAPCLVADCKHSL